MVFTQALAGIVSAWSYHYKSTHGEVVGNSLAGARQ
jgi:hypothetical protein